MGTWGEGNFQSDGAMDFVASVTGRWEAEVQRALGLGRSTRTLHLDQLEDYVMPRVGLLLALAREGIDAPPEPTKVRAWRDRYLAIWDREVKTLGPARGYARKRRAVLARTFEELLRLGSRAAHPRRCAAPKRRARAVR